MEVSLFGIAREIVGDKKVQVGAAENISTVGGLKTWMKLRYPALAKLTSVAVAVDSEYADDLQTINNESEVAIIPPVSGG